MSKCDRYIFCLSSMDFRIPLVIQGLLICFCLAWEANFIGACLLTINWIASIASWVFAWRILDEWRISDQSSWLRSSIKYYHILICVDNHISVIKPWTKMIPVKWYDIIHWVNWYYIISRVWIVQSNIL